MTLEDDYRRAKASLAAMNSEFVIGLIMAAIWFIAVVAYALMVVPW